MAIISIAKILLILCGLTIVLSNRSGETREFLAKRYAPIAVLMTIFLLALSLTWTRAPPFEALASLVKHGKLILILLVMMLIRNRYEAKIVLATFALAQTFLLLSSWMLFTQLPVPWATSRMALNEYAVFSSYLDQGIISTVFAAICWHLRDFAPGRLGPRFAIFLAIMALVNVFFILAGRSGHIVAISLISLTIMWELPKKYRSVIIFLPFVLAIGLFFSSNKVRDRLTLVQTEVQSYSNDAQTDTSSGVRLRFWITSLQSIREHPVMGTGVGSWTSEYNRLQRENNALHRDVDQNGNPHQEYLLWGVQLGIPGILLIVFLMFAILKDSRKMEKPVARATQSTLLALTIVCFFNASIYDAQIGDFFCILLGLLLAFGLNNTLDSNVGPLKHDQAS